MLLAERTKANAGEDFKSESYLNNLKHSNKPKDVKITKIMSAHEGSTGRYISGEVTLAPTLCLLAGGGGCTSTRAFCTRCLCCLSISYSMILPSTRFWTIALSRSTGRTISPTRIACRKLPLISLVCWGGGIFNGCIGAIDRLIIKIRKPGIKDNGSNTSSFFIRKRCFGLNVVTIIDKKKQLLYRVIVSHRAEHELTAFKNSKAYGLLMKIWQWLKERRFHFIGDLAYSLNTFLLMPFDGARHGDTK